MLGKGLSLAMFSSLFAIADFFKTMLEVAETMRRLITLCIGDQKTKPKPRSLVRKERWEMSTDERVGELRRALSPFECFKHLRIEEIRKQEGQCRVVDWHAISRGECGELMRAGQIGKWERESERSKVIAAANRETRRMIATPQRSCRQVVPADVTPDVRPVLRVQYMGGRLPASLSALPWSAIMKSIPLSSET